MVGARARRVVEPALVTWIMGYLTYRVPPPSPLAVQRSHKEPAHPPLPLFPRVCLRGRSEILYLGVQLGAELDRLSSTEVTNEKQISPPSMAEALQHQLVSPCTPFYQALVIRDLFFGVGGKEVRSME